MVLVLVLAGWVGAFAGGGDGRPGPVLWLLAGMVAAYVAGRMLGRRPGFIERTIAVAVAGAVAITWPGILHAGGAPTGYGNANATLSSLGVLAAMGAALHGGRRADRRCWIVVAAALTVTTLLTASLAGTASLLVALALVGLSVATRSPGFSVMGGLIAVVLVLAVTTAVAFDVDPLGFGQRAGVRAELWTAAADLVDEEPVRGIGPGQFAEHSQVSSDADLRWAHHGYLQAAAEYGLVGLLLVLALAGWAWVGVWRAAGEGCRDAAVVGGSLAIIGLHATVDYVWHVPTLMVLLAVLLGEGTSSRFGTSDAESMQPRRMSAISGA